MRIYDLIIMYEEIRKFNWPLGLQRYRYEILFHELPVKVVGISQNGAVVSYVFKNLKEAISKLPNLPTEYNNPIKDYVALANNKYKIISVDTTDAVVQDTKYVCIRFDSNKLLSMRD